MVANGNRIDLPLDSVEFGLLFPAVHKRGRLPFENQEISDGKQKTISLAAQNVHQGVGGVTLGLLLGIAAGCLCIGLVVVLLHFYRRNRKTKKGNSSLKDEIFAKLSKSMPVTRSSSWSSDQDVCSKSSGSSPLASPTGRIQFSLPQPPTKSLLRAPFGGHINPELYKSSPGQDSRLLISQATHPILGWLEFSVGAAETGIKVTVLRAIDLPGRRLSEWKQEKLNVFAKIILQPDDIVHQTKVKKNTLSPVFNETFIFKVSDRSLTEGSIRFSLYDIDKRHLRHPIGHVTTGLATLDLGRDVTYRLALEREPQMLHKTSTGEIDLELTYNVEAGKLKIEIIECISLPELSPALPDSGANVFVRALLLLGRKVTKVKDTRPHPFSPGTLQMSDNVTLSLPARNVDVAHLLIQVMCDGGQGNGHVCLGQVELGGCLFARGEQLQHWQNVLETTRVPCRATHRLSMTTEDFIVEE